jgi:hypothetical protein
MCRREFCSVVKVVICPTADRERQLPVNGTKKIISPVVVRIQKTDDATHALVQSLATSISMGIMIVNAFRACVV